MALIVTVYELLNIEYKSIPTCDNFHGLIICQKISESKQNIKHPYHHVGVIYNGVDVICSLY